LQQIQLELQRMQQQFPQRPQQQEGQQQQQTTSQLNGTPWSMSGMTMPGFSSSADVASGAPASPGLSSTASAGTSATSTSVTSGPLAAQPIAAGNGSATDAASSNGLVEAPGLLKIGEGIEAQCPGWGVEWHSGTIRDLLPNGEVQVLWEGDAPSISNVPPALVRRKVLPTAAAAAPNDEAATGVKRAAEDGGQVATMEVAAATLQASEAKTYRYDLSPGNSVGEPVANLRRRVEAKLEDGCHVIVVVHITRPSGRPEHVAPDGNAISATATVAATAADGPVPFATVFAASAGPAVASSSAHATVLPGRLDTAAVAASPGAVAGAKQVGAAMTASTAAAMHLPTRVGTAAAPSAPAALPAAPEPLRMAVAEGAHSVSHSVPTSPPDPPVQSGAAAFAAPPVMMAAGVAHVGMPGVPAPAAGTAWPGHGQMGTAPPPPPSFPVPGAPGGMPAGLMHWGAAAGAPMLPIPGLPAGHQWPGLPLQWTGVPMMTPGGLMPGRL